MQQKRAKIEEQLETMYKDSRHGIKESLITIESLLNSTLGSSNELQHQNRLLDSAMKQADHLLQQTDEVDRETKKVQKLQKLVNTARSLKAS
jgi:hypothetical protein